MPCAARQRSKLIASNIAVAENSVSNCPQNHRSKVITSSTTHPVAQFQIAACIEMSRDAQNNPNSRSVHTKNYFSKKRQPFLKLSSVGHTAVNKRKPSFVQLNRHHTDRGSHDIVFKPKRTKDYIITDVVLKNEGVADKCRSVLLLVAWPLGEIF